MNSSTGTTRERVGVVGAGLMGAGIVEVCARNGCDVVSYGVSAAAILAGRARVEQSLQRAQDRGKIDAATREATWQRITFTTDVDALADRDLVFEAIIEREREKTEMFALLDSVVKNPDAVLATNTSSIPVMSLAMATTAPERVIGVHFFNPVPVLPLVELVTSLLTSDGTSKRAQDFVTDVLGKTSIRAADRAGFVVNALLVPYLLSAIRMYESGAATARDIDDGMVLGCAHPMGPLALADLIGLDTVAFIADAMYQEYKEPLYAPPPVLQRMVQAGLLGRKAGQGFHPYSGTDQAA
jgi:3-hydroxybutyryl-CoA dehydrogenase